MVVLVVFFYVAVVLAAARVFVRRYYALRTALLQSQETERVAVAEFSNERHMRIHAEARERKARVHAEYWQMRAVERAVRADRAHLKRIEEGEVPWLSEQHVGEA